MKKKPVLTALATHKKFPKYCLLQTQSSKVSALQCSWRFHQYPATNVSNSSFRPLFTVRILFCCSAPLKLPKGSLVFSWIDWEISQLSIMVRWLRTWPLWSRGRFVTEKSSSLSLEWSKELIIDFSQYYMEKGLCTLWTWLDFEMSLQWPLHQMNGAKRNWIENDKLFLGHFDI